MFLLAEAKYAKKRKVWLKAMRSNDKNISQIMNIILM